MGYRDAYEDAMQRSLAWFAARPSSDLRFPRARALYYAERWSYADTLFEALTAEAADNVDYRGYRGVALAQLGRRDEALEIDGWLEQLDRPFMLGANTRWRAAIAAALRDREGAVRLLQQAYGEGMYLGYEHHRDPEWETLQDYRPYLELMGPEWRADRPSA